MRTIQHPDVEFNETDLSQYNPAIAGTTSLTVGFADKGEDYLPLEFTSRTSVLTYFGKPTNEAERYFYNSILESITQNGKTIVAKLPYNNTVTDTYMKTIFTVGGTKALSGEVLSAYADYSLSAESELTITSNGSIALSALDSYRTGATKPDVDTFVVIDKTRQTLSDDNLGNETVGTFVVVNTAYNALPLQDLLEGDVTDWYSVSSATTSGGLIVDDTTESYYTSGTTESSLSSRTAYLFPAVTLTDDGDLDPEFLHQISVSVIRQFVDSDNNNKITSSIVETFVGSLNPSAINVGTGDSTFIDNIINSSSNYIDLYSNVTTNLVSDNAELYSIKAVDADVFGFTTEQMAKKIKTSTITTGLDIIYGKLNNIDDVEIDQIVDAGLTTIASYCSDGGNTDAIVYDPSSTGASAWTLDSRSDADTWRSVAQKMITFCQTTRKDCMAIIDGPRNLAIEGNQKIVRPSAPTNTIDTNIIPKLKYITGLNSSYGAMYPIWGKKLDDFTGEMFWLPPSITANGVYIYTDRISNYWMAPAGWNRGVVSNINDIAFNPNGKQQDSIFTKAMNPFISSPFDGIIINGDKTLQTKPSAFDSINVRRMFLRIERATRKVSKYYLFEGNNSITRQRFVDQITPTFTEVQVKGGILEFKIICDESNNTPEVIDRGELLCSILIKPVKGIRYIILNFVATSTGVSLEEVIV
jgi:hypothetical protein